MKVYKIINKTIDQEFIVSDYGLDRIINSFCADGYQVLNEDTGQVLFDGSFKHSPTMVFRLEKAWTINAGG